MTEFTNRSLYLSATQVLKTHVESPRSLVDYLRCLGHLLVGSSRDGTVTQLDLLAALQCAFTIAPPSRWPMVEEAPWLRVLERQVVDLVQMSSAGSLEDPMRSFGVDAPGGSRWYNFTPHGYIECGLVGAFGGWDSEDDTGRILVSGPGAGLAGDGSVAPAAAESSDSDVQLLAVLDAEALEAFFMCGQLYE